MSSTAKFCENKKFLKRSQVKTKIKYIKREINNLKEDFMKLEGYTIEIGPNCFITFNKEKDYTDLLKIEYQIQELFKVLLIGKCTKKYIYKKFNAITKYLNNCELEEINIFYNPFKSDNPFNITFPYICFNENEEKKDNLNFSIKKFKDEKLEKKSHNLGFF